jgi:protein phosphatase 2C family protein 2/3
MKKLLKKKEDKNANNSEEVNKNYKKKKTFGLTISTLAKLDYDSYPNVELNSTFFNIISGYGGNSYNGIKRDYNEDRIKIISEYKLPKPVKQKNGEMVDPKISYFAIYDGHGGEMCCNFLQENLHKYIFNSKFFPLYTIQAISTAYTEAEKDFSEKVIDPETGKLSDRSGSCAVSALIMDEYCFITNLGDSRALYSYNSGKQLYQVTRDHKPNDPIEKERIEKAGGKVVKGGMMKYNGTLVELVEKSLPAGVIIPYRLVPGNIAVSKY